MSDEPRFVFEYEITQRDIRDWQRAVRATWFDWLTFTTALALLAGAGWSLFHGRNAEAIGTVALAGLIFRIGKRSSTFSVFMWLLRMRMRFEMDEDQVRMSSYVRKSETPSQTVVTKWSDLAKDADVNEHDTWFAFSGGHGVQVGIPKRVFESEEQMVEFREFLYSKMGSRCDFAEPAAHE